MNDEKTITAGKLAGYGMATYLVYKGMEKICIALGDMGQFGVISMGKPLTTYTAIVSGSWFIPALCGLSFLPLILKVLGHMPRRVYAHDYTSRRVKVEAATDMEFKQRSPF